MPDSAMQKQIEAWEAERDEIVGQDFTPERSRRVEELDGLIDRVWERLDPNGKERGYVR